MLCDESPPVREDQWRRLPPDPDLRDHVVDAFRITPNDAISIPTIRGVLHRDGRPVSNAVVLGICDELAHAGVLECTNAMGVYLRRYRLIEPAIDRRPAPRRP